MGGPGAGPVAQWLSSHVPLQWPGVHWFGSRVPTWHCLASYAVAGVPHIKQGRWAWMLARGQSSSAKRGGLVADVSSGLIFLKKIKDRDSAVRSFLKTKKNPQNKQKRVL